MTDSDITSKDVFGIHHVTAITSNPQRNIDFYTGELGLRLVKLTVNQDDPTAYHLYYGDELGRPGTILTFFTGQTFLEDVEELVRLLPHPF
jgi:glyoxalase family protein